MGCAAQQLAVPVAMLLILATTAGWAAGANPAAALATAAGHPARLHLRAEATRVRDGQTETATLESVDGKRLERICIGELCTGTWFDGVQNASFGINGTALPDRDDGIERTFAAIASTAFAEADFTAAGGTVSALPGIDAKQLLYRVTAPRASPLIAVADARTHRLTDVEFADGTPYRHLRATASGATIVYASRVYDRVVAVDEPLVPPAGPPLNVAGTSEVALLSNSLPIVPCTVQGRQARCLIDTGTIPSAITLDFAERLGQEPYGRIEIAGLGSYLTGVIDVGALVLGSATFDRLRLAVIPHTRGTDFDLIIGSDALVGMRVSFDIQHRRVRIAPTAAPTSGRPIAVSFAGGLPYVDVLLGTRDRAEPMLVDTGDSGTLSIGYDEYRLDTGLFAVRGAASAAGLGGVSMDALQGQLERADVGGERIERVAVSAVRGQHTGHVGYGFAARCGVFIVELGQHRIECGPKSTGTVPSTGDP